MGRKSKFILGLESKRYSTERIKHFTEEEKRFIIEDYLSSGKTKRDIWYKYPWLVRDCIAFHLQNSNFS